MSAFGKRVWYVPDCYYPENTVEGQPYFSHESICVLNTGDREARIHITLYFEDRDPMSGFITACGAGRTHHIRLDRLKDGKGTGVPKGVPYALVLESDVPLVAQYSRLDTTQLQMTLATTMAYPID